MQLICEAYASSSTPASPPTRWPMSSTSWNEGELQSYLIQITGKALEQRDPETGEPSSTHPRQGRAEGHRPVDPDQRRRKRRRHQHHQRRGRSPHAVLDEGRSACRQHAAHRPGRQRHLPKAELCRKCTTRCTPPRSSATPRASTSSSTVGEKKGWGLDLGASPHLARRLHHPRALPQPHHRGLPRRPGAAQPDAGSVLQGRAQPQPAELARGGGARRDQRHPGAGLQRLAGLLRQLPRARLPANLLQAQRDFFGAHTYERTDKPEGQCSTPSGLTE
jgi:6-phosphogluconate dehydrogenase